jgi:hypothetical protein
MWKVKKVQERLGARLVRYADDCVVVAKGHTERVLNGIEAVLADLSLTLNKDKTTIVDANHERLNFLDFVITVIRSPGTRRKFPFREPFKKAVKHIRAEIKGLTCKRDHSLPIEVVIEKLNQKVRAGSATFIMGTLAEA